MLARGYRLFMRLPVIKYNIHYCIASLQHTTQVMWAMTGAAMLMTVIPFKFGVMSLMIYLFMANSKMGNLCRISRGDEG